MFTLSSGMVTPRARRYLCLAIFCSCLLPASCLLAPPALPLAAPSPRLQHGTARGSEGRDIASARLPPCPLRARRPCLAAEGMEGRSTGHEAGLRC